jgi:collagenase-like PrtC family protease
MPLAYSARCFTARAHRLNKDDCQYRCLDYPDGLTLTTQDDNRFLALNGIQTQSARSVNLLGELPRLDELQVDVLRISPQAQHTAKIVESFAAALSGTEEPAQAAARLESLMPTGGCDGYWHGVAGMQAC